jgi:hypothetical protein
VTFCCAAMTESITVTMGVGEGGCTFGVDVFSIFGIGSINIPPLII